MTDWDARWMSLAREIATWSKDPVTKVGCAAIGGGRRLLSTGYNGFPRGVDDDLPERYLRPAKYMFTEHAERNLIYNAARNGVDLYNSLMYCTLYPCADCARGIVQAGVLEIVTPEPDWNYPGWVDSFDAAKIMLAEAGVRTRFVPSPSHGEVPGH
jgi:dCMP deaminase